MTDQVLLIGDDPNGFAQMLGAMAEGNLASKPHLAKLLDSPGVVRITATDAEVTVALEFGGGKLRVHSGNGPRPDVAIAGDTETLMGFSSVPQLGPIPDPRTVKGRDIWRQMLTLKLKVKGAVLHGALLQRMSKLLAVD